MISFTPTIAQLRMLATLRGNMWLVQEQNAVEIGLAALELAERHGKDTREDYEWLSAYYTLRKPMEIDGSGVAHIEVRGALMHDAAPIYEIVGLVTRYSTIQGETTQAATQGAKAIVYHINSPGGSVLGNVETAEMIFELGIPTVAFCDGLSCSAAYKISSSCNVIVATKSALIGNIGTILSWTDCSEFWKKWGVEMKAITSEGADLKSTFHKEPDDAQVAFLQDSVNRAGAMFREHVKIGRMAAGATLDPEVWRAGWYSGEQALSLGLIDEIGSSEDAQQIAASLIVQ